MGEDEFITTMIIYYVLVCSSIINGVIMSSLVISNHNYFITYRYFVRSEIYSPPLIIETIDNQVALIKKEHNAERLFIINILRIEDHSLNYFMIFTITTSKC